MENARRKAYTARTFRMTTQQFIDDMEDAACAARADDPAERDPINGGVPIKSATT